MGVWQAEPHDILGGGTGLGGGGTDLITVAGEDLLDPAKTGKVLKIDVIAIQIDMYFFIIEFLLSKIK